MPKMFLTSPEIPPAPRGRPIRRALLTITAGLLVAPLVIDLTSLCVVHWRVMAGAEAVAETPTLDTLGDGYEAIAAEFRRSASWLLHDPPWRPTLTFAVVFAWVVGAIWLLRRP